jgi:predicted amidohydrolase
MIIAAAQFNPKEHNTEANIKTHLQLIDIAAQHQVQFLIFPEMSLTGYERELAKELSFSEEDERLSVLKDKAILYKMMINVGAPIKINSQLHIGSFIFLPDGNMHIYTKQFLHTGEEKFFSPSFSFNPVLALENEKITTAICADIANPLHPENAAKQHTTLYTAGIFYTEKSMPVAFDQLSSYAKKYRMNVLMANYCGHSYQLQSGGQSAFWDNKGNLIGQLDNHSQGLLIVDKNTSGYSSLAVYQ